MEQIPDEIVSEQLSIMEDKKTNKAEEKKNENIFDRVVLDKLMKPPNGVFPSNETYGIETIRVHRKLCRDYMENIGVRLINTDEIDAIFRKYDGQIEIPKMSYTFKNDVSEPGVLHIGRPNIPRKPDGKYKLSDIFIKYNSRTSSVRTTSPALFSPPIEPVVELKLINEPLQDAPMTEICIEPTIIEQISHNSTPSIENPIEEVVDETPNSDMALSEIKIPTLQPVAESFYDFSAPIYNENIDIEFDGSSTYFYAFSKPIYQEDCDQSLCFDRIYKFNSSLSTHC